MLINRIFQIIIFFAFIYKNIYANEKNSYIIDVISSNDPKSTEAFKRFLLEYGLDINLLTDDGESLLHLACIWGNLEKISTLLNLGADPNFRANKRKESLNMTPLTWCTYAGYVEAVNLFINNARTNVNLVVLQEDGTYITALDIANKIGDKGFEIAQNLKAVNARTYLQLLDEYGEISKIPWMP